jgi:PAS domain S-box-containing protein
MIPDRCVRAPENGDATRPGQLRDTLAALRGVGHVLVRETDFDALIQRVCDMLTEGGAYEHVWIALHGDSARPHRLAMSRGLADIATPFRERLVKGETPYCVTCALETGATVVVSEPDSMCADCPLSERIKGRARMASAVTFAGRAYGVIAAVIPPTQRDDAQERALFTELAGDLAFALHKIEYLEQVDELHTHYRSLFENSHVPMLLVDPDEARIVGANPAAVSFYGWSRSELIGKSAFDINTLSPDDLKAELEDARLSRRNFFRFRHRLADGSIRDVEVYSSPVKTQGKDLLFSIVMDVTERVRQQTELADTKYVLEEAQKIGRFGHYDFDIAADRWTCADVLRDMFGIDDTYPRTAEGWLDLVDPVDRQEMRAYLADTVIGQGLSFDHTYRIRRKVDGTRRWVHGRGRLFRDANGRPVRLLGTIQDVTDIEETYQRLNDTIRDFRLAQRIAHMGNWRYDPAPRMLHVSEELCRIYSMRGVRHAVPLDTFLNLHAPADRPALSEAIRMTSRKGGSFELSLNVHRPDGRPVWVEIIGEADPERRAEGALVRGTVQDITAEYEIRDELRRAKESADLANRSKSEFLANVSHEIRTPLNAVIGFAEVMSAEMFGPHGTPQYKEYSALIEQAGKVLLDLVNDVIDLSRVEVGALELNEEVLDLSAQIQACLRLFEMRARNKRITLSATVDDAMPRVRADVRRLRQIIMNLLSNAIKFTPQEGRVSLEGVRDAEGCCVIRVSDTGIGVSPDQIDRILSVFGRAPDAYVRDQEGAGLGLPLCKRLTELHGGTLSIDSEPGAGTTVSVVLPASRVVAS